ncbi:MAG: OmpA family protein [Methylophilaceae bacterium]|jgi:peptidoglycan-associated lipoprotein|nr:peptidoglycan-binding protein [Methylophilaceae bacterium]
MKNTTKLYSKLLIAAAISMLLVACQSTPMKSAVPADTRALPVPADTRALPGDSSDSSDIKGAVIDGSTSSNMSELNDPDNILSKRNIYFDYNSDAIRVEFRPNIEAHAKYLQEHGAAKVMLQGNADERGTREYNLSLGQRRSVSVKKALNILGVSDSQIETVSYGEENASAYCSFDSDSCYQLDRRVEIVYPNE